MLSVFLREQIIVQVGAKKQPQKTRTRSSELGQNREVNRVFPGCGFFSVSVFQDVSAGGVAFHLSFLSGDGIFALLHARSVCVGLTARVVTREERGDERGEGAERDTTKTGTCARPSPPSISTHHHDQHNNSNPPTHQPPTHPPSSNMTNGTLVYKEPYSCM